MPGLPYVLATVLALYPIGQRGRVVLLFRGLRSNDSCCNEIEPCVGFCDYSKLVNLCKIGEVHFRRLFGTNGFHAKAKNERFSAAGWRCLQTSLRYENSLRHLADYAKKLH